MGKALIVSSEGDGLYRAKIQHDRSGYDRQKSLLDAALLDVTDKLDLLQTQLDSAIAEATLAQEHLDHLIAIGEDTTKAEANVITTVRRAESLQFVKSGLIVQKASIEKRLEYLASCVPPNDAELLLWCADLTEDMAGEVGTIEPAGDEEKGIILYPGDRTPLYNVSRDGFFRDPRHMSPSETFYNAAMLPGAQKWYPIYRIGAITSKDGLNCQVLFDSCKSDAQELDVNQTASVTASFDYMECNGQAFIVGDRVVVAFYGGGWGAAHVIGFESNPRACSLPPYIFIRTENRIDGTGIGIMFNASTGEQLNTVKKSIVEIKEEFGIVVNGWVNNSDTKNDYSFNDKFYSTSTMLTDGGNVIIPAASLQSRVKELFIINKLDEPWIAPPLGEQRIYEEETGDRTIIEEVVVGAVISQTISDNSDITGSNSYTVSRRNNGSIDDIIFAHYDVIDAPPIDYSGGYNFWDTIFSFPNGFSLTKAEHSEKIDETVLAYSATAYNVAGQLILSIGITAFEAETTTSLDGVTTVYSNHEPIDVREFVYDPMAFFCLDKGAVLSYSAAGDGVVLDAKLRTFKTIKGVQGGDRYNFRDYDWNENSTFSFDIGQYLIKRNDILILFSW